MSIKKESLGNLSSASLSESYKCSECLHHMKHAHPQFREVCKKRGIKGIAVAPKCFTPDVSIIASNSDSFVQLAALLNEYTPREKRILIALMKQKPISKKRFSRPVVFGMKMFFLGMGADYISNYLAGYVMGLTSTGELIITGSPEQNTRGKSFMAYMTDDDNLMTPLEWKRKKTELKAKGRVFDPKTKELPRQIDTEAPPTIDSAPAAWHDKQEKKIKKKGIKDLTDMVFNVSGR
jgi:hypothetical protein